MATTTKIDTIMSTLKEGYKMMLAFGMDRVEARKVVLETLEEMGLRVNIAEEIING
jgi:hypothetical protein